MHDLTIQQLHEIVGGRLRLATLAPRHGELAHVGRVVTDSRHVEPGDVFWGLPGARFDGAHFAGEAFSRGAQGVIVGQKYVQPWPGRWSLEVPDAHAALLALARHGRRKFGGQLVAVTGSVGKTTTRQMIKAVLGHEFQGTSSPKNYNNHVGLPLSMLVMAPGDDYAVLELAANAPGEIARLTELCQPHIGVITRVGDAHLGGFGSLEQVAAAKWELITGLQAGGPQNQIRAALCGDDPRLRRLGSRLGRQALWFGRELDNDLVATHVTSHDGHLSFEVNGTPMSVEVWGRHYLNSALAAVAVGRMFGMCDAQIARGLADFEAPPMRCQISKVGGATIINDTYNASPLAMRAALELLRDMDAPGRRIVVCGDMRELGEATEQYHRTLGDQVVTLCGADLLVACGEHAQLVVEAARAAGMPSSQTVAVASPDTALSQCEEAFGANPFSAGDVILVKGSRALAMERLVGEIEKRSTNKQRSATCVA